MLILNVIYKKFISIIGTKTLNILETIKMIFLVVLCKNLYVLMINLANQLFFTEEKNAIHKLNEAILEEYNYCKQIIKSILIKLLLCL